VAVGVSDPQATSRVKRAKQIAQENFFNIVTPVKFKKMKRVRAKFGWPSTLVVQGWG
jgi:hypothetical protein